MGSAFKSGNRYMFGAVAKLEQQHHSLYVNGQGCHHCTAEAVHECRPGSELR